jgi:hypothetical protein
MRRTLAPAVPLVKPNEPEGSSGNYFRDVLARISVHLSRRQFRQPFVGVFEEAAGVERDLQPRRTDRVDNAQHPLWRQAEAPVVLEAHHDTALLGLRHQLGERIDDPAKAIVIVIVIAASSFAGRL